MRLTTTTKKNLILIGMIFASISLAGGWYLLYMANMLREIAVLGFFEPSSIAMTNYLTILLYSSFVQFALSA